MRFFFLLLFVTQSVLSFGQINISGIIGSKWRIEVDGENPKDGRPSDSFNTEAILKQFSSATIVFETKRVVSIIWEQYKIKGKYRLEKNSKRLFVDFKGLETFEKGPVDKALFASYVDYFKSQPKYFRDTISFYLITDLNETKRQIAYKRMNY